MQANTAIILSFSSIRECAKIMAEVLLVDDNGSVLLTMAIALRRRGHDVTVACDADQALTQLRQRSFDFLISDVRMPGISGLELATRVQRMTHPPRVILTSAYPFVEHREGVFEAFLPKPLDVRLLNEYLNSSLQQKSFDGSLEHDAAILPRTRA